AFSSAESVLTYLDGSTPGAIVSDVNLPGVSGTGIRFEIRKKNHDVPVLLMSGSPSVAAAARAVELGALRFMLKPLDSTEFVDSVKTALKLGKISRLQAQAAGTGRLPITRYLDLAMVEATLKDGID